MCSTIQEYGKANAAQILDHVIDEAHSINEMVREVDRRITLLDALLQYHDNEKFYEVHQLFLKYASIMTDVMVPYVNQWREENDMPHASILFGGVLVNA